MKPRLAFVAGPLKGINFPLREEVISIGRDSSNQISVSDRTVSGRHCLIKREAGKFKICDLESRHGTFVNGISVRERVLADGDRIIIAGSEFFYVEGEEIPESSNDAVDLLDGSFDRSSVELRPEDSQYIGAGKFPSDISPFGRMARDLHALVKISTRISSIKELESLERELLELIFEVVPAERGAVILMDEGRGEFNSIFGLNRISGTAGPIPVSRYVARKVVKEKVALLCRDVAEDEDLASSDSLRESGIRSVLCVPLIVSNKVTGMIYLDRRRLGGNMTEDHLQLATAIAGIGAGALANARHMELLENECTRLRDDINIEHSMVGESAAMREIYKVIAKAAPADCNVLILGESGTGKELVARAIHNGSRRANKPFVAVNCAALVDTLLESELFGHEKGAFTGALAEKKGRLEVAYGGTLFLDEMGDLAPALQAKLLRVLQEHEYERVGGTRTVKVDIRLIAATNRKLEEAARSGSFRQDLYYRLNVVTMTLPPLRNRPEDIRPLASHFASKHGLKCGRRITGISPEAWDCLLNYHWPGNVRELQNAIERAVVMGSSEIIMPEDLPEGVLEAGQAAEGSLSRFHTAVRELKKQLITGAVLQSGGNYTEAAKLLGLHPNYLHRLIRNLNLKGAVSRK